MSNDTLFDRAGGIRPMAEILGRPPSTVQSWKTAGRIPAGEQPYVIECLTAAGIECSASDVVWPLGRTKNPSASEAA